MKTLRSTKNTLNSCIDWSLTACACIVLCLCVLAVEVMDSPTVYLSHNRCVGVAPVSAGTCENLPSRYTVTHVSPNFKGES